MLRDSRVRLLPLFIDKSLSHFEIASSWPFPRTRAWDRGRVLVSGAIIFVGLSTMEGLEIPRRRGHAFVAPISF